MKEVYPVILWQEDGTWMAKAPDIRGCVTSGDNPADALEQITDALHGCLCVMEDIRQPIPTPGSMNPQDYPAGSMAAIVPVDTAAYRRTTDTKAVRKNVSMPAWMADMADARGINCSQVLQDALRTMLLA